MLILLQKVLFIYDTPGPGPVSVPGAQRSRGAKRDFPPSYLPRRFSPGPSSVRLRENL